MTDQPTDAELTAMQERIRQSNERHHGDCFESDPGSCLVCAADNAAFDDRERLMELLRAERAENERLTKENDDAHELLQELARQLKASLAIEQKLLAERSEQAIRIATLETSVKNGDDARLRLRVANDSLHSKIAELKTEIDQYRAGMKR